MRLLILIFSLTALGCAIFDPRPPVFIQDTFTLTVKLSDDPNPKTHSEGGTTYWRDGHCLILIMPEYYTHRCLGHELRHCLEGDWHKGKAEPC